jgi:hypothetical protein
MNAFSTSRINGQQPQNLCDRKTSELPKYKNKDTEKLNVKIPRKIVIHPEEQEIKQKPSPLEAKFSPIFGNFNKFVKRH